MEGAFTGEYVVVTSHGVRTGIDQPRLLESVRREPPAGRLVWRSLTDGYKLRTLPEVDGK